METTIAIQEDRLSEVKQVNETLINKAKTAALAIRDDDTCKTALEHGSEINRRLNWWEDFIKPTVDAAYKAWKTSTATREAISGPLKDAKSFVSAKAGHYHMEQERKRREEEARKSAEIRKKQEEQRLQEAIALEESGRSKEADRILKNEPPPPVVTMPRPEPVKGTSMRTEWKFKIVDEELIPRKLMVPDLKAIGHLVTALKDKAGIPGVEVYHETKAAFTSKGGGW